MKLSIINEFGKENISLTGKTDDKEEKIMNIDKEDLSSYIDKYIIKVKKLFFSDLSKWGNRIIDVMITNIQDKYDMSYIESEEHIIKYMKENDIPRPNRAKYNYNVCREMDKLPDYEIVL